MKIFTQNLREYSKLFEKIHLSKNAEYGSVHLDFKNSLLSFRNEISIVQIDMILENTETDSKNVFIIDGEKFFFLVNSYDFLIYKDGSFHSPANDKFTLMQNEGEFENNNVKDVSDDYEEISSVFLPSTIGYIKKALLHILPEELNLNGIFFDNGNLISLQKSRIFQAKTPEVQLSLSIPSELIRIIFLFPDIEKIKFYRKSLSETESYKLIYNNELALQFSSSSNLNLPISVDDEAFKASYSHENYFMLNKLRFQEVLKFLEPFAREVISTKLTFKFLPETSQIEIEIVDQYNNVDYKIPVEEFSNPEYFEDQEINLSLSILSIIASQIEGENIIIHYDSEKPAMKFASSHDPEFFIINSRFK